MDQSESARDLIHEAYFQKVLPEIIRDFANTLEERYTEPYSNEGINPEDIENIRNNIPVRSSTNLYSLLTRICQEFRLMPDDTDRVRAIVFKNEDLN
jgi:hypothetical protein